MSEAELRRRLASFLAEHTTLVLATAGRRPDGSPRVQTAPLFYASRGLECYFMSDLRSEHAQNLTADPRAAASVAADGQEWRSIRGVQMEGGVELLVGAERERALRAYCAKFPFVAGWQDAGHPLHVAVRSAGVYRFRPQRLKLTDNTRGFGHREELTLPPDAWRRTGG